MSFLPNASYAFCTTSVALAIAVSVRVGERIDGALRHAMHAGDDRMTVIKEP
jgi:hypothetical protein